MTLFWLTVITASRLAVCVPVWLWCWWKRPKGMVVWMALAVAWYVYSDMNDGNWARENGLVTDGGYWLDHSSDVLFWGSVFFTTYRGSREAAAKRRAKRVVTPPDPLDAPPSKTS